MHCIYIYTSIIYRMYIYIYTYIVFVYIYIHIFDFWMYSLCLANSQNKAWPSDASELVLPVFVLGSEDLGDLAVDQRPSVIFRGPGDSPSSFGGEFTFQFTFQDPMNMWRFGEKKDQ